MNGIVFQPKLSTPSKAKCNDKNQVAGLECLTQIGSSKAVRRTLLNDDKWMHKLPLLVPPQNK